mmetsp:Transcript_17864/g.26461  ORF Transcript_17864/g.26461 Transcript_17864/m.26461 type:complete len:399 (-) Transcript_17864:205-1401(-)|eukprot:CAMPEP_0194035680 /NCGR_PEP_ID=MMETSP0009_2-20130614/8096_1 /TAXON_ID=210454 /ORGANISM="Grammatophora oceanica, Strain CCMP 410" /LENGTH=398 /DNA_ID=CAMNT_0038677131 /DNA_START=68 /DNA_END=1264 /DNA_ORIENTATION=-
MAAGGNTESGESSPSLGYVLQSEDAAREQQQQAAGGVGPSTPPSVGDLRGTSKKHLMAQQASTMSAGNLMEGGEEPHQRASSPYTSTIRNVAWHIVNDLVFQRVVVLLIVVNAVTMGVQTMHFVKESEEWSSAMAIIDDTFLVLFTIELILQYLAFGYSRFLHDGWLMFDFLIISFSWILIRYPVQVLRSFRILRALRLVARIRELKDLVKALVSAIPRMFAIFLLLSLVFYVYAVMFTQLYGDLYEDGATSEDYFSSLTKTAFTLTRIMTLDSWTEIVEQVMAVYGWAWIPFFSFVLLSSFIVINLIIAVICDAVAQLQTEALTDQLHAEIAELNVSNSHDATQATEYQRHVMTHTKTTAQAQTEIQGKLDELTVTLQWLVERERKREGLVSSTKDL